MGMDRRSKKIAAAMAAVELLLAEEAAAAAVSQRRPRGGPSPTPWALAGRLSAMASRLGPMVGRRG